MSQRDYSIVASYLKYSNDPVEMEQMGRRIAADYPELYTPLMMEKLSASVRRHIPAADPETQERMLYRSIYDYWAYGNTVDEEFYLHFDVKNHDEKKEYLVNLPRCIYTKHLNGNDPDYVDRLEDKYRLYQRLKPYYRREMIELETEADFPVFEAFAKRHETFVVKPSNFFWGTGVHKASVRDYGGDARTAFDAILSEGEAIHARHTRRTTKMVVEELIEQDESMAVLHPQSVNALRITTVRAANGEKVLYRPRIKMGRNGDFIASGAKNSVLAEIDPVTGVICTDGFNEANEFFVTHPNSGIKIKGFQIPRWPELLSFMDALNREMSEFGYIGWDIVLSKSGWCVLEGNYYGEIMSQLIRGGLRKEFEELIGWKFEMDHWWELSWQKQREKAALEGSSAENEA